MKRADPRHQVTVIERNGPDDTFGFGVVFSDATLDNFLEADPVTHTEITQAFAHWDDIDVHYRGEVLKSTGHGFSGLGRQKLLSILQRRARSLGVTFAFSTEVVDPSVWTGADLVVAADGVNSWVRSHYAAHFEPRIDWRPNRFVWLGTTFPFPAFTFIFKESDVGLWRVHAYRYEEHSSTFILESDGGDLAAGGARRRQRGRDGRLHREAVRARAGRPPGAQEPLAVARLPHRPQRALAPRQRRAGGRCRAHGALLDRLGHQARDGRLDRAGAGARRVPRSADGAGRLRGRAPATGRDAAARGPDQPRVVRADRAVPRPARAAPVRLQPSDAQPAAEPREPQGARRHVRGRGGPLVRRSRLAAERRPRLRRRPRHRRCSRRFACASACWPTAWWSRPCASTRRRTARRATGTWSTSAAAPSAAPAS